MGNGRTSKSDTRTARASTITPRRADFIYRRAVEAAIWGLPIVSVDAMRQAYFRDAGASYNDVLFWSKPADWRFQFTTPNSSTNYVYFNFNLKNGPIVVDVPPAEGAGLFGSLLSAWQVPLADVGPAGEDVGNGGKYLLLPPGYHGEIPNEYFAVPFDTVNGYALLRAIPASSTERDVDGAIALVKRLRVYPFSSADVPRVQHYIDAAGTLLDGVVPFDEHFFDSLSRMVSEEPVLARDLAAMGQLHALGIEKERAFTPDEATTTILRRAAADVHAELMAGVRSGEPWWPGTHWTLLEQHGARTGFSFQDRDALYVDERALIYFVAFAPPKSLGAATFYLVGANDRDGRRLDGARRYRLHVPPNVPARQYWAVTVYDLETACFLRNTPRTGLDSYDQTMRRNPDGSVDIHFGPSAPAGREANWIPTTDRKSWFALFRFYGPDTPILDRTWSLNEIEPFRSESA